MAEFLEEDCSEYLGRELRVEPEPNGKCAPISEMRLITRDYGISAQLHLRCIVLIRSVGEYFDCF